MLVSVIIPTFGEPLFLDKAILSVLNQTLKNIELIVVDDNDPSTDERFKTESILSFYLKNDTRVKYIKHEKNLNGAVARNTGIANSTGKYIAFLDSDDEYMYDRLEKCYKFMENAPNEIGGVYTGCEFRKKGKKYHVVDNVEPGNYIIDTLAGSFMFCTGSNFFIRKRIINDLDGFDETFIRHQDYEFLVRFFEKYSLGSIKEVLVIKNNENFNVPNVEKLIEIKKKYIYKFNCVIEKLTPREKNYIYHTQCVSVAESASRSGKIDISKKYYKIAKDYSPLTLKEKFRKLYFFLFNLIK
ncbi:MAG TPA: glycosyltransferase family 2 protein [Saprospiraceae bacterium]|nr:glycosyltransferase family 2 protein [Saprospiraceae bacterium]